MKRIGLSMGTLLLIACLTFVPAVYGVYLAFTASVLLGMAVLLIQPTPLLLGWAAILGHPEVCSKLAVWLHLPV